MDRLLTRKIRDQEKEIFMKLTAHYIISSFYFHIHQIKPTYPVIAWTEFILEYLKLIIRYMNNMLNSCYEVLLQKFTD